MTNGVILFTYTMIVGRAIVEAADRSRGRNLDSDHSHNFSKASWKIMQVAVCCRMDSLELWERLAQINEGRQRGGLRYTDIYVARIGSGSGV